MEQLRRVSETDRAKYKRENPLQKQRRYINNFLDDNHYKFEEAMDDIFEHDKKAYAKLYIEMQKSVLPKAVDVDVKHNISKEMEDMMMLGRAGADLTLLESEPVEDAEFEDVEKKEEEKDVLPLPPTDSE